MLLFWILFNAFALGMLVLDLLVFHRKGHVVSPREALGWSALWIILAACFAAIVSSLISSRVRTYNAAQQIGGLGEPEIDAGRLAPPRERAAQRRPRADAAPVERAVDMVVPEEHQHRVLFWGILGALTLRGIFIGAGVGLIHRFHWLLYAFGAFLIYSGIKFLRGPHQVDPQKNPFVKALRRWLPVTETYEGGKFLVRGWRGNPGVYATPLLAVLILIETTDVLFAVDSIPAILAITLNAFIVYTSNVFAILGLRSMYFAVSELIKIFRFLHYGLALVLILVGAKMITADHFRVPTGITLAAVAGVLLIAVVASVMFPEPKQ